MPSRKKTFTLGALISLVGTLGIYSLGTTPQRCYETIAWPLDADGPPPELTISSFAYTSPLVYSFGMAVCATSLLAHFRRDLCFPLGRRLFATAGICNLIAACFLCFSSFRQCKVFAEIASSQRMPDFDRIGDSMLAASSSIRLAWGILLLAQVVTLIGLVSSGGQQARLPLNRQKFLLAAASLTVLFGLVVQFGWWAYVSGLHTIREAATAPKPAEIATVLASTTAYMIAASIVLAFAGLTQWLASIAVKPIPASIHTGAT